MRRIKFLELLLKWRWYPDIIRIPVFVGSFYLMYVLLFGDQAEGRNTGLSILWVLMWSLQPIMFIVLGRFWCGICPFSTAGDLIQKAVGNEIHPPLFIKKYGVWFAYSFFIIILVIEALTHMSHSTAASAILLMSIFTMAMISGAIYKRRTWCRYLCPLGVAGGVFSRLRVVKLSKDSKICNDCKDFDCLVGTEKIKGCPMGLCVRKHDLDADCISCGNCLKSCPNDSPYIELRSPVKAFLSNVIMNRAESAFTSSFIGFSVALYLIKYYPGEIYRAFGFENHAWNELLVILIFTGLSFLLFYTFSYLIQPITRQSLKHNFRFFGFFLIPYVFFALFNLTSIHEVILNGMTLIYNFTVVMGLTLPETLIRPLISVKGMNIIQGLGILAGSIVSVVYCLNELKKALTTSQSRKIIALFSMYLVVIAGCSLYLLIFL
ncbi:MAG: 4Fe-4S binding protein [Bacteroidales bacterium]